MAKLVVLSEGMTGLAFELKPDRTTVGRLEDNAVHIPEASVSSHHCEIIRRGDEVIVKDLSSTNGTFINGQQITESGLKPGQILRLGQIELRLESGGGPPTPASPAAPAPPATSKKTFDKTVAMPQGVKAGELGQSGFQASATFSKKSNKANKIFIWIGVIFLVLVVGSIVLAYLAFQK